MYADFLSATIDDKINELELLFSWVVPKSTPPLQIIATNWPHADKIDVCKGNLIATIAEVIALNKIMTEEHLILSEDLFGLNPKQTIDLKTNVKERHVPSPCHR